jgi:transposase-like protein
MNFGSLNLKSILAWSEEESRSFLELMRWPDGPVCPKCGNLGAWKIQRVSTNKNALRTFYKCKACRRQFTVTLGTIFEDSHIPLAKWIGAMFLLGSSKKGISAHQLHRMLWTDDHPGAYKSAWFMVHRIREAMQDKAPELLSGIVEADETYIGPKHNRGAPIDYSHGQRTRWDARRALRREGQPYKAHRKPLDNKEVVFGIVERGGKVRTAHIAKATGGIVGPLLRAQMDMERSRLITDESNIYFRINAELPHDVIRHKSEYVRGDVHTNTIEGYWAILKRGLYGVYQHVDAAYLGRYLDEFEYRFNSRNLTDTERFVALLCQVQGRVMWYCRTPQPENPFA